MEQTKKDEILEKAKKWMLNDIAKNHIKNTEKLVNLDEFNINPFLWHYLANYYCGDSSPKALATVAMLPRVLGSSITTSFGTKIQSFISDVLDSFGSAIDGIDIEYTDAVDGCIKFCQLKSGPNSLNKSDVTTVKNHFDTAYRRLITNNRNVHTADFVYAMVYGDKKEYNPFVKELAETHTVICGEEFWYRLTGDQKFYFDLIKAMAEVAEEVNAKKLVEDTIECLAKDIKEKKIDK